MNYEDDKAAYKKASAQRYDAYAALIDHHKIFPPLGDPRHGANVEIFRHALIVALTEMHLNIERDTQRSIPVSQYAAPDNVENNPMAVVQILCGAALALYSRWSRMPYPEVVYMVHRVLTGALGCCPEDVHATALVLMFTERYKLGTVDFVTPPGERNNGGGISA